MPSAGRSSHDGGQMVAPGFSRRLLRMDTSWKILLRLIIVKDYLLRQLPVITKTRARALYDQACAHPDVG
jgi:hypothetical protein